jgi:peroxiredoxin
MKKLFVFLLIASGFVATAQDKPEGLFINSKAPNFSATDQDGNTVSLKDLRKKGNVVLIFYRGNWCSYCNKQLQKLQDSLSFITEKGASLIAIAPETPEGVDKTVDKTKAKFPVIYDEDMKISKAYQVYYKVDPKTVSRYKSADIDLLKVNKQTEAALPVPAVYIINKDGEIKYRFLDADYRKRPSVKEIISNL